MLKYLANDNKMSCCDEWKPSEFYEPISLENVIEKKHKWLKQLFTLRE